MFALAENNTTPDRSTNHKSVPRADTTQTVELAIDPASVREQLVRINGDPIFRGSPRLLRLLSVIVERTLEARPTDLKEYSLAVDVFERPASFDPRLDPIVRVRASNLRAKLTQYYASSGSHDPLRIEIPRGSYEARFSSNSSIHDPSASIAVLPCIDLSPSRDQEYFCDGITEEIISALSAIEGIRVTGRTSSFYFKNNLTGISEVGERLGVENVLESSCRRDGRRIRVTARLVQVTTGLSRWSKTFESELKDVFAVQQEIAASVANALNLTKKPTETGNQLSTDMEAYNLFLLGRFHLHKRTVQNLRRSVLIFGELLTQNIAQAPVLSALAECHIVLCLAGAMKASIAMPTAERLARKALSLDDELPDPHSILAIVKALHHWDWQGADQTFRRALQLNSNHSMVRTAYACACLMPLGRTEDALRHLGNAVSGDPLSLTTNFAFAFGLYVARHFEDAILRCGKILDMEPGFLRARALEALALAFQNHPGEAIERAIHVLETPDEFAPTGAMAACVLALAGKRNHALQYLKEVTTSSNRQRRSSYWTSLVHASLSQKGDAFRALNDASSERDPWLVFAGCEPLTDTLRDDKRFERLLRRMGLSAATPTVLRDRH
jgi:serine/threonine-protein kinase